MADDNKLKAMKTNKLSLAAFAMCHGATLKGVEGRHFTIESEKTMQEWEIDYTNSAESQFNINLISLNEMRRGGQ